MPDADQISLAEQVEARLRDIDVSVKAADVSGSDKRFGFVFLVNGQHRTAVASAKPYTADDLEALCTTARGFAERVGV